jgi:diguanylate cyclase (GGDEF)-like protein
METTAQQRRTPGLGFTAIVVGGLASASVVAVLTLGWAKWSPGPLVAIAVLAVLGELTAVEAEGTTVTISGTLLGLILAAVLLGCAPAALIGLVTISIGWLRARYSIPGLTSNLVVYALFPLLSALLFHGSVQLFDLSRHNAGYYFLVLPTFVVGVLLNFLMVNAYTSWIDRSPFLQGAKDCLMPVLAADLFSAVLITGAVFLVVKTGTVGIIVLAGVLVIFQYLVGELLKSRQRAEELRRKATTDELTGLANRERFSTVVAETIEEARRSAGAFAVMLVDLDHFKEINDTLGHHYGDVLLKSLGPRLAEAIGADGVVARLGGDEFAVLPAEHTDNPTRLAELAEELLACVQQPIEVDELSLEVGASVGIARFPLDGDDVHALLRRADVAMYAAKEDHSVFKLYAPKLDRHSRRRLTVLSDFRRALDSDEFILHFQPVVDIDGAKARGAEGLVRWEHPELGLIPPTDFIPIAEQSGLIGPLTRYVLEHAVAECKTWREAGRDLSVAVNLTVRDLLDRRLPKQIEQLLASHQLPAEALQLEITESMIMSDPERALETVTSLRALGVKISVDDFGTGYSSLANLKTLPVNELKIDRTFVSSMLKDQSDLVIVRSTINLGHELSLEVVAEGVEDDLTLRRLANLGCDLAQGYHLSRPLPGAEFVAWLDQADGWSSDERRTGAQLRG